MTAFAIDRATTIVITTALDARFSTPLSQNSCSRDVKHHLQDTCSLKVATGGPRANINEQEKKVIYKFSQEHQRRTF
jgi:hypothetical protein